MLAIELEMIQYDCPYVEASAEASVIFFTKQWGFDTADRELESRVLAHGEDAGALERGIEALQAHANTDTLEVLHREEDRALIHSVIGETDAMSAVRANDGYITGPFEVKGGTELWRIGFDSEPLATAALSDLDDHNEYSVRSRESVNLTDYYNVLQHVDKAADVFETFETLTDVEYEVLVTAAERGYFDEPRQADLSDLAEQFDVSKTAVSQNLRRAQRKLLDSVVDALGVVHGSTGRRRPSATGEG